MTSRFFRILLVSQLLSVARGGLARDTTVLVHGKGSVAIQDVQVGDRVLVDSEGHYEPVYAWAHFDNDITTDNHNSTTWMDYVRLQVGPPPLLPLTVTKDHLVLANHHVHPLPANQLAVGDSLWQVQEGFHEPLLLKVQQWQVVAANLGNYAPLTPSGQLLVANGGVLVSNYYVGMDAASNLEDTEYAWKPWLAEQDLWHILLTPYRMMCIGMAPSSAHNMICQQPHARYVQQAESVVSWMHHHPRLSMVEKLMLGTCLSILAILHWVEVLFGPTVAPWLLLLVATLLVYSACNESSGGLCPFLQDDDEVLSDCPDHIWKD